MSITEYGVQRNKKKIIVGGNWSSSVERFVLPKSIYILFKSKCFVDMLGSRSPAIKGTEGHNLTNNPVAEIDRIFLRTTDSQHSANSQ